MAISMSHQEEEINKMIEQISMRVFLKATPYASGYRTDLEREMTPDFFYQHLYYHSSEAEKYISTLQDRMNRDQCKNIILYGYQGCGKTTFVHYMLREIGERSILINFDAYVDKGNEIKHELASHLYRAIMCDVTGRDGREGLYPIEGRICSVSKKFCEVFNSEENRRIISENFDAWSKYIWLFDKLKFTMALYSSTAEQLGFSYEEYKEKKRTYPEKDLKEHIAELDINQLMVMIVLWDIAYSLAFEKNEKCSIVFENLDTIYNASALPDFTKQILYFRNNIDSILAELQYEGASLSKMHSRYTLIFVMRETTKCEFVDHFVGKVEMYIPPQSMSFLYEMSDVVQKRYSYIKELEKYLKDSGKDITKLKRLEHEINQLHQLLLDPYVTTNVFGLFNRNFRVASELLSEIAITAPSTFSDAVSVKKLNTAENWCAYASRCILFRQIFNRFSIEKYFDTLKHSEYHIEVNHKNYSVNLSRYILLYLNNKQGITKTGEEKETLMIPLNDLFQALLSICSDKELIVNSLWNMYEMRKTQFWGHLITFDGMLTVSKSVLKEQLEWVVNSQERGKTFGKVRITTAGFTYLESVLPHFEYFAAKHFRTESKSLFSYTLEEFLSDSPDHTICMLSYVLAEVRQEFENCFYNLSQFYRNALQPYEQYSLRNFPNSEFAWRKVNPQTGYVAKMFHGERIFHAHIGYLDSLRFYCFSLIDQMKKCGYFDVNIDVTKVLKNTLRIHGIKSHIPTIWNLSKSKLKKFIIHSNKKDADDILTQIVKGKQKVEVIYINGDRQFHYIPLEEISEFFKVTLNFIIVDTVTDYIKTLKPKRASDSIAASSDNIYLVSCYLSCIRERIEKNHYADFVTSICRKTGAEIIKLQIKSKKIRHKTQLGKQILDVNYGDNT